MGLEDTITLELAQVLGSALPKGDKVTTQGWKTQAIGMGSFLNRMGSQNIPKLLASTKLLHRETQQEGIDFWKKVFELEKQEMYGSEVLSWIYDGWHMIATAAVLKCGIADLVKEAQEWLRYDLSLRKALEVDGRLVTPGQRSAGHAAIPGLREWIYAMWTNGDTGRAERWCRAGGVGLKNRFEFSVVKDLAQLVIPLAPKGLPNPGYLKSRGMRRPLTIRRYGDGSLISFIGSFTSGGTSNDNPNTPPVIYGRCLKGNEKFFPDGGGVREQRVRERFDDCHLSEVNGKMLYNSTIYGHDEDTLPDSKVVWETTIGKL